MKNLKLLPAFAAILRILPKDLAGYMTRDFAFACLPDRQAQNDVGCRNYFKFSFLNFSFTKRSEVL